MHLLIKITTDIHKQLIANYKYYFWINARTVTSYLQSPEKDSLLGVGQCARVKSSLQKEINSMFLPYSISCKAVSSTDEGPTSQRAWGRRCRRSPVRCGGFDPSLSLRNDRTGLSKIPFVKTYVVCLLLWDILCKSRGWDIPLSSLLKGLVDVGDLQLPR